MYVAEGIRRIEEPREEALDDKGKGNTIRMRFFTVLARFSWGFSSAAMVVVEVFVACLTRYKFLICTLPTYEPT